jgi:hypothetical protein
MADALLNLTLKNATFEEKDGKMAFGKIEAITKIGGTYMKDGVATEFTELENTTGITSEGLTEALNKVPVVLSDADKKGNESNGSGDELDKAKSELDKAKSELETAQNDLTALPEDADEATRKAAQDKLDAAQKIVNGLTTNTGGARKSRKAKRTKKGGKKRRSTQRRQRKSR